MNAPVAQITEAPEPNPFERARRRAWIGRAVGLTVLAVLAFALWEAAGRHSVTLRKEEPVSVLMAVAPPPPPPPPPVPKPIPKEVMKEPTPLPQPVPRPQEAPQPVAKAEAVTENAPAQEGSDDFQIGAGSGGGMVGGGGRGTAGAFNRAAYASYFAQLIQHAVQADAGLRNRIFRVSVNVWLGPDGKVTRAELRSSTGSDGSDQQLRKLLESLPVPERPPPPAVLDDLPVQMSIQSDRTL